MMDKDKIKLLAETEAVIRREAEKLANAEEVSQMLQQLKSYRAFLNQVQACPQLIREHYFEAVTAVFNYLRRNRQLGRAAHRFEAEVVDELHSVISKVAEEYGIV